MAPNKNMGSSLLRYSGNFKLFRKNGVLSTMAHCSRITQLTNRILLINGNANECHSWLVPISLAVLRAYTELGAALNPIYCCELFRNKHLSPTKTECLGEPVELILGYIRIQKESGFGAQKGLVVSVDTLSSIFRNEF